MNSNNPSCLKTVISVNFENIEHLKSKDGKFHYFYKIVNNINNKYYYGVHSTYDINDNYVGSGTILNCAYKKYGFDNFTKYIIAFFDDRKSLLNHEKFVVNEELVKEDQCYNMSLGGNSNTETLKGKNYLLHTTKNLIHINNSIVNKMVKANEIDTYISEGWVIGQLQKSTKGKILINKNGEHERFIYPEELEKYLSDGWSIGGKSRNKGTISLIKNNIWINNGNVCKRVSKNKVNEYILNGWNFGPIQRFTKGYIRITNGVEDKNIAPENIELLNYYLNNGWRKGSCVKRNNSCWVSKNGHSIMIKNENLEKYLSEEWKRGRVAINDNKQKGKVAVYNEEKMIYIPKEDLEKYLSEGWKHGNPKNLNNSHEKGKIRINNGIKSKNIPKEDLEKYLSEGWKQGGLIYKKTKGRIRVTNGTEERMISIEEFENYDKTIWRRGLIKPRNKKEQ